MTLHICKDFLSKHTTSSTVFTRYYHAYVSAMFLRGVLGFTQVGHTNFNIDGSTITKAYGVNSANINIGTGSLERAIQLPSASYVVSNSDVNRVISLHSNAHSYLNSGLYRVNGYDTNTNSLIIDNRSWLESPPSEAGLSWRLFENEAVVTATFMNGGNGVANPGYRGVGSSATTTRVILQSPHSTAWQLRICCETPIDTDGGGGQSNSAPACSLVPGFGGNSSGDFTIGGRHLHPALFFNLSDNAGIQKTNGWLGGLSGCNTVTPGRYYMWGDDATGSCVIITRQHGTTTEWNNFCAFGIPEDEEVPLPSDPVHRLFVFGGTGLAGNTMEIEAGPRQTDAMMGSAFGLCNQPVTCVPGSWQFLAGTSINASIMHDSTAGDSVYTDSTELYGWDLYAGTWDYTEFNSQTSMITLEPRRLGLLPFVRRGRENYNTFTTSNDAGKTWIHMQTGIFLPWSGSIVP